MTQPRVAWLVLADGAAYRGDAFGAPAEGAGEVVFHTGMTGYQEILTDPSYSGQIVCMTYPEIGNTGTTPEDEESRGVFLRGFVVRNHNDVPSSWRCRESLHDYLVRHGVPGVSGIDTRALVRRIRTAGAMNGIVVHGECDLDEVRRRAAALPSMAGRNLVDGVTCDRPYEWNEGTPWTGEAAVAAQRLRVVAYDFGVKRNILRELANAGFDVTVVPAKTPAREVLALEPDGIFLSNGPGDPAAVEYAAPIVRELLGKKPIFGICLGHQILGLALGMRTCKLRFGHHGANQPARDAASGRVMITSENHGFAIDPTSIAEHPDLEVTHVNLNDQTIEGICHRKLGAFSVQYHPEAAPGPHDSENLFRSFRQMCEAHRAQAN
jgi:carbamoyl-phosphate synthase small subunit